MLERIRVDAVVTRVHHIVVLKAQARCGRRGNLEGLITASRGNDGICRSNGGDDVLDGSLRKGVRDTRNVKLLCSLESLLVDPSDMLGIVLVELRKGLLLLPGNDMRPLDAVLRLSRDRGDGAKRNRGSGGVHVQLAFYARGEGREDDPGLALEALRAAINQRLDAVRVLRFLGNGDQHRVDPSPSLDAVQAADDELELLVELVVKVLDPLVVRRDLNTLDPLLDELGCDLGLVLANV